MVDVVRGVVGFETHVFVGVVEGGFYERARGLIKRAAGAGEVTEAQKRVGADTRVVMGGKVQTDCK